VAALAGLISSLVSLVIAVYPIINVTSRLEYALKISAVVVLANVAGVVIYRAGRKRAARAHLARAVSQNEPLTMDQP
jgi:hypothetical protein